MQEEIEDTTKKAFGILAKIKDIEATMKPLNDEYDALKVKILREMSSSGIKKLEIAEGTTTLVEPKDREKLDIKRIATDLGLEDLEEYKTYTSVKKSIRLTPIKK